MRRSSAIRKYLLAPSALSAWLLCSSAYSGNPSALPTSRYDSDIQLVKQVPVPPTQPMQPTPAPTTEPTPSPTTTTAPTTTAPANLLGGFGPTTTATLSSSQQSAAQTPGASVVGGAQAQTLATTDVGDLLSRSSSSQGVEVQRRSPIATDPRVRGYHTGQLTTVSDGAFWLPARADLDTIVSKIDSNLIRDVVVIKGPYSVRYGPGFAFIDVETQDTPRYQNCGEVHGSTGIIYKQNGSQWNGLQTFWGGSSNWGFRMAYNILEGDDYAQGNWHRLPTEYNSKNYDFAYGFDLSENSHIELKAVRVEQQPVLFPGLIFDVNYLATDAYTLRYVLENQICFDKLVVSAWYNYTRFNGDNFRFAKRQQIPQLDLANFYGATDADAMSLGFRSAITWGREKETQFSIGLDLAGVSQHLNEFDNAPKTIPPDGNGFNFVGNFPIPRSHSVDPGLFMDFYVPVTKEWSLKAGGRVDLVSTNVEHSQPQIGGGDVDLGAVFGTTQLDRQYFLGSGYVTSEYKMNCHWTGTAGAGFAMRPPTLTELYADEPFLGILQQGFTSPLGNPQLSPEQVYQVDLGIKGDFERLRGGLNGFYAFINDYVTYAAIKSINGIQQASLEVQYTNTALATLAGFETYAEFDLYDWLTPFATISYVDGRDHTRDHRGNLIFAVTGTTLSPVPTPGAGQLGSPQEPLPQIAPMETHIGVRLHQPVKSPRWGMEVMARIVDSQNAVASSLLEQQTAGFVVYNARAYWQARQGLLLTAGVENFTNLNYREHLDLRTGNGVFQPGINVYVGTQLRY